MYLKFHAFQISCIPNFMYLKIIVLISTEKLDQLKASMAPDEVAGNGKEEQLQLQEDEEEQLSFESALEETVHVTETSKQLEEAKVELGWSQIDLPFPFKIRSRRRSD